MNIAVKVRKGNLGPRFREQIDRRVSDLTRRFSDRLSQSASLSVVVDSLPKKGLVTMAVRLALPGRVLQAAEEGKDPASVINKVFGELERQVDRVRARHPHRGPLPPEMIPEAARVSPLLLTQDIASLFRFIQGELDAAGSQVGEDVEIPSPQEVLSDVLVKALETWEQRPAERSIIAFLFQLAVKRIDQVAAGTTPERELEKNEEMVWLGDAVSLDGRQPRVPPPLQAEGMAADYWEYWQADDSPSLEDLVAGPQAQDPEAVVMKEEEQRLLRKILAPLPPLTRQAVLLHEVEAFEPGEISMIQVRPEREVVEDLAVGYKHLQDEGFTPEEAP